MDRKEVQKFQKTVRNFYKKHGRDLPWRKDITPYKILVSEIMLQQTQVDRVIPYYKAFLKEFPTIKALSDAKLKEVLRAWSGLGYNRRAKFLHEAAKAVVKKHGGRVPNTEEELIALPGVGAYTAGAVLAFAFNKEAVCIETNIRTAFIHHFFPKKNKVSDKEILNFIRETMDTKNPREWHWALMDYGASLKQSRIKVNNRSAHYVRQSRFKGSSREKRGKVIKALLHKKRANAAVLSKEVGVSVREIKELLEILKKEGIAMEKKGSFSLP